MKSGELKKLKSIILDDEIKLNDFNKLLIKIVKKINLNEFKNIKYKKVQSKKELLQQPLDSIIIKFDFGSVFDLFCVLNKNIKERIKMYFIKQDTISIETFSFLFYIIKKIRNRVSHNETLYDFGFNLRTIYRMQKEEKKEKFHTFWLKSDEIYKELKNNLKILKNAKYGNLFKNTLKLLIFFNNKGSLIKNFIFKTYKKYDSNWDEITKKYITENILI